MLRLGAGDLFLANSPRRTHVAYHETLRLRLADVSRHNEIVES